MFTVFRAASLQRTTERTQLLNFIDALFINKKKNNNNNVQIAPFKYTRLLFTNNLFNFLQLINAGWKFLVFVFQSLF